MKVLTQIEAGLRRLLRTAIHELRRTRRVIVIPEAGPRGELPFFVIGAHRSGTTLLRLIVDSHSHIACPPESYFLLPLRGIFDDPLAVDGLTALGFPRDAVMRELRAFASRFFDLYAAAQGKRRWADKTPPYVDCLDFIDELWDRRCRFILLYRHGLDSACSVARMRPREAEAHVEACGGDRYAGSARYWAAQCRRMRDFQRAHADRCLELRYEDLSTDPEPHLRRLFEFVDEPWEPAVLRFHEHPHDHWIGLQDSKAAESKGFQPNSGVWRTQPPEVVSAMLSQCREMLVELGYEVPELRQAGAARG